MADLVLWATSWDMQKHPTALLGMNKLKKYSQQQQQQILCCRQVSFNLASGEIVSPLFQVLHWSLKSVGVVQQWGCTRGTNGTQP